MNTSFVISTNNLSKNYADKQALKSIRLEVPKQSIYGLLGPNGAGKTTLISILSGILHPSSGDATVCSYDVVRERKKIKKKIGVVPQELALFSKLTVKENLEFFGVLYDISKNTLKTRITTYLNLLELWDKRNTLVNKLSGGMKRKLHILVGILNMPEVLFLDEPTVGVDINAKKNILHFLKNVNEQGTTIIYTSHYLEEAQRLCTHVSILDNGTFLESGTIGEVLENTNQKTLEDVFFHLTGNQIME